MQRVIDWKNTADKYANTMGKWKACLPQLEKDCAQFRATILDLYFKDEAQAINMIASIDVLATLPIFLNILRDLKRDNDKKFEKFFSSEIGEKLEGEVVIINDKNKADKVVDHFEPLLLEEIAESFEKFLMDDEDAVNGKQAFEKENYKVLETQLTAEAVQKKFNYYRDSYYKALCEKFPLKEEALKKNKDQLYKYMNMELFLLCAIRTFIGADNAQKLDGWLEKFNFWHHYRHGTQIRKPFLSLTFSMSGLEYTKDTNELWHEVRLYLQGFYNHVMLRTDLQKAKDEQDHNMQKHLKVSKEEMAAYNLVLVKLIEPHLLPKEVLRPERNTTAASASALFSRPSTPRPTSASREEIVRENTPRL